MAYNGTTAVANAPSRRFFAPMFKARWQNMQNVVNDTAFYSLIPSGYQTYYYAYIRQWAQWASGFVPQLHQSDFFSTGIGYTVCDIMAKECLTGGFRINSTEPMTKEFLTKYADENGLSETFYRMFFHSNATGNCILVLTPVNGELTLTPYPLDRVVFQIGRKKEITSALILNRFVAGETVFYAREKRLKKNGKYYYKVELANGTLATSPSFTGQGLQYVPEIVEEQFKDAYGDIKPRVWYELPKRLRGIGCYNVPNKPLAVALKDMPGYSDSTLHTCLDILYSIDYNYTQSQVDQYMGKSRALVPKQMGRVVMGQKGTLTEGHSFYEEVSSVAAPLDDQFFTQVESGNLNGETVKPLFIQPDLREQAHKYIRDSDLELLASKVGLSSSDLANHLNYNRGGDKTATEVVSESDTTEKTVNEKRSLAQNGVNKMLSDLAYFYGFEYAAEVEWGKAASNSERTNQELLAEYQAGVLSLRDYLRKRWTDLTEEEIEQKATELEQKAEQDRLKEQSSFGGNAMFDEKDYYGNGKPETENVDKNP